jgi:hypothetical protein
MFIPDPDFYSSWVPDLGSRISDPESNNDNKTGGFCFPTFFVARKITKLKNYFIIVKEKNLSQSRRIIVLFSQKCGFGIRDPGYGKNIFQIPDPGAKKAPDPVSGSATLLAGTVFLLLCIYI